MSRPATRSRVDTLSIVFSYALFAGLWILLSDGAMSLLFRNPDHLALAGALKGWLFVLITSLLLFVLLRRLGGERAEPATRPLRILLNWPSLVITSSIIAATLGGIALTYQRSMQTEVARLQAVADLKAQQLADWLEDRSQGPAQIVRTSTVLADWFRRWQAGDKEAGKQLILRLEQLNQVGRFTAVSVLDSSGQRLWGSPLAPPVISAALRETAMGALQDDAMRQLGPHRGVRDNVWLDFIVPLGPGQARAVVVLHLRPQDKLFPMLESWPIPSRSGETILFRRDGEKVLYLSTLRHQPNAAASLQRPVNDKDLLASQVLLGTVGTDQVLHGHDYRNQAVFGVVRPVAGTDWYLLAKEDRSEALDEALRGATWIGLSGGFALCVMAALLVMQRQRQQLQLAESASQAQRERLQALNLLATVVDHSEDCIFAVDRDGRFTLINRALERLGGHTAAEVLGRNEHVIFPAEIAQRQIADNQRIMQSGQSETVSETLPGADGPRSFLTVKTPLRNAAGEVIGLCGIARDISQREASETRIRLSEERLQLALEASHDGMWDWDLKTGIAFLSPRYYAMCGYRAEEIVAHQAFLQRLVHPEDWPSVLATLEAHLRGEQPVCELDYRILTCHGDLRWVSNRGKVVARDSSGRPLRMVGTISDITERKQAEASLLALTAELRDSQTRLQLFVEHAPAALAMLDRDLRYLAVSQRWITDQQLEQQPILGRRHDEVFPHISEQWSAIHQRALAGEIVQADEDRFERDDGTVQWLKWLVRPWHGIDGEIGGIMILSEDITTRVEAAEALRLSEARLSEAQQVAHIGSWELDLRSNELWWSDETYRIFELPQQQQCANYDSFLALVHPEDRQRVNETYTRALAERSDYDIVHRICMPDGRIKHVHEHCETRYAADGTPQRSTGTVRDVTASMAVEARLRQLALAVEQSPESILITDLDSSIEYVNEAFCHITGYTQAEVLGRNPSLLRSGKTPATTYTELWAALNRGESWKGELINRCKDGREFVQFGIITPLRQPDGQITHYVAVQEDITEKKRMGSELDAYRHNLEELVTSRTAELEQARLAAEAANQAKSAFLANMSHEIRTPMNAILGLTYLLQSETQDTRMADRLAKIDGAARHLLAIINDILDLSKIEAGRLLLEERDFSVAGLLDNVRSMIFESARNKGLHITQELDEVPAWLRGDVTRVRQALLNYASNAVKFTERGGVTLRASLVDQQEHSVRVRFEVQDSGAGIDEATQRRLFQAFEQADASTTRKYGGTGLGLAITRRLAAMMGGEAGVTSSPGTGSTFWFTAQLARGQESSTADEPRHHATGAPLRRGARVLVAEDSELNRQVAVDMLLNFGLTVSTAENGHEAVERVRQQKFDLVLMDMQMPEMDGLEATHAIRLLPGMQALPIIAMTANAFDENRHACLAAGMTDFVPKPVDPDVLRGALERWLPAEASIPTTPAAPATPAIGPAAPEVEDTLARLSYLPGFDIARGLNLLNGKPARYLDLMRRFATAHRHDIRHIRASLARGDTRDAQRTVHTLKGLAGTFGATALAEAARDLEIILLTPDKVPAPEQLQQYLDAMSRLLEPLLDTLQPTQAMDTPPPADPAQSQQILAELRTLLAQSDVRAQNLCSEHTTLLRPLLGDAFPALLARVQAFEFEAAAALLAEHTTPPQA